MKLRRAGGCVIALGASACTLAVDASDLSGGRISRDASTAIRVDAGDRIPSPPGDPDAGVLPPPIVEDAFERESATGLGEADRGGTWSASAWTATGGRAKTVAKVATSSNAILPRIATADVDVSLDCAAPELADGTGAYFYAGIRGERKQSYTMALRIKPDGKVDLNLTTMIAGDETQIAGAASFTTTSPSAVVRMRGVALGTRVRVKAWKLGEPEPDWLIDEANAVAVPVTSNLEPYFSVYLSSTATATHPYFADNFVVRPAR